MKKRVYIVGVSPIAYYHAEVIERYAESESSLPLLYVTDENKETLAAFTRRFPWATPLDNLASVLDDPPHEEDIVIVAAPPARHSDISCQAHRSGRHVLDYYKYFT